jgi:hypothetical protein
MSTEIKSLENKQKALTCDLCFKGDSDSLERLLQVPIKSKSIQTFLDFKGLHNYLNSQLSNADFINHLNESYVCMITRKPVVSVGLEIN